MTPTTPFSFLLAAQSKPVVVTVKNGETYHGHLKVCDPYMNICLQDVICTSRNGDRICKMTECYIRGTNVRHFQVPDDVIQVVKDDQIARGDRGRGRGGRGGGDRGGRGGAGDGGGGRGGGGGDRGRGRGVGGGDRGGGRGRGGDRGGGRGGGRGHEDLGELRGGREM